MNNQFNFIRPFLRAWIIILAAMVGAYLLASKYLSYATPMYESTAKLRLADINEGVTNSNLFKDLDVFATTQKIQAEIELIKSHAILKKALGKVPFETVLIRQGNLKNTELFSDAPILLKNIYIEEKFIDKPFFLTIRDQASVAITDPEGIVYQGKMQDTIQMGGSALIVALNDELLAEKNVVDVNDQYTITFLSEERQISEILKNLDVSAVDKDVAVIRISYKSSHPEKAALLPNMLAEAYIEDYIENKFGAANVTVDFLNDRILEISNKLGKTEAAILNYREENGIANIRQETETDLRKISQLKIQQTNLKMSLDAIKELDEYMEKGRDNFLDLAPNFEAFTDLLSTEMIKKIKQLQAERRDLLLEYTETDDKVVAIELKIQDISSYLRESIRNTYKNLQSKYTNLVYDIEEAEKVFISVPEKEKVLTILNREFEIYQQSYNFLNQKKIEADIARAAKISFHRVITPASISKMPVSPNRVIIKGVAVILGLLGAIILTFIVHSLKARVHNISTVESSSLTPIIAAVPKVRKEQLKETFFLTLLTQWEVKKIIEPNGIIVFTGYEAAEGMRFISREVIQTLERQSRKLLIVRLEQNTALAAASFYTEHVLSPQCTQLTLDTNKMVFEITQDIQNLVNEKSRQYDQTIIVNSKLGETYTLALMAVANLNVFCIDTRLTPAKNIIEVDLLKEEYGLPGLHFAVNRVNYNPSFIRELFRALQISIHYMSKNTINALSRKL